MNRMLPFAMSLACLVLVGCGGVEEPVSEITSALTITDHPTLTAGGDARNSGFSTALGFGSMSPTKTSNGFTYAALLDHDGKDAGWVSSYFSVSGFSASPGAAWLTSVQTAPGPVHTGATATYVYSAGTAKWTWTTAPLGFGANPVACTIVHN